MEVVASLSQGRTAAAQSYKSVPVIFEPPCSCLKLVSSGFAPSRFSLPRCSDIEYKDVLKRNNTEVSCLAMICMEIG